MGLGDESVVPLRAAASFGADASGRMVGRAAVRLPDVAAMIGVLLMPFRWLAGCLMWLAMAVIVGFIVLAGVQ